MYALLMNHNPSCVFAVLTLGTEGWVQLKDEDSGHPYYCNQVMTVE